MGDDLKKLILSTQMPKFVWVAELSNKTLIKKQMANGVLILDATEAITTHNKPLILAAYQNQIAYFETNTSILKYNVFPLQNFSIFENNLKSF
jgi:hypothetical protein